MLLCFCVSVCDAWDVSEQSLVPVSHLLSDVERGQAVDQSYIDKSIGSNAENAAWLRVAVGESCYLLCWVAIALFISKAILTFATRRLCFLFWQVRISLWRHIKIRSVALQVLDRRLLRSALRRNLHRGRVHSDWAIHCGNNNTLA